MHESFYITDLAEFFWGIANGSCWVEDAGEADEDVDFSKHLRDVTDCLAHYICIRNI